MSKHSAANVILSMHGSGDALLSFDRIGRTLRTQVYIRRDIGLGVGAHRMPPRPRSTPGAVRRDKL